MKNKVVLIIIAVLFVAALIVSVKIYGRLSEKTDPPANTQSQSAAERINSDTAEGNSSENAESDSVEKAADFYAFDLDGNKVTLAQKIGKPVVVNFWATWCPPCKAELPHFEKLYKELGGEVEFMMVDMTDGGRETVDDVKDFVKENGYTFPVYCDSDQNAAMTYSVYSIPVTLFIDKEGNLSDMRIGVLDEETLKSGIEKIRR